jgi:hypothetical protein
MTTRTALLIMAAVGGLALGPLTPSLAEEAEVSLFKVVTIKDDVVVGMTKTELEGMGPGAPVDVFADELQRRGQLPVWQYASARGDEGELVMSPLQRIVVVFAGTARIEPYKSALKVVAPSEQ